MSRTAFSAACAAVGCVILVAGPASAADQLRLHTKQQLDRIQVVLPGLVPAAGTDLAQMTLILHGDEGLSEKRDALLRLRK